VPVSVGRNVSSHGSVIGGGGGSALLRRRWGSSGSSTRSSCTGRRHKDDVDVARGGNASFGQHRRCRRQPTCKIRSVASESDDLDARYRAAWAFGVAKGIGEVGPVVEVGKGVAPGAVVHMIDIRSTNASAA